MDTFGGAIDLKEGSLVVCSCIAAKRKKGDEIKVYRGHVKSIEFRRGGEFKSATVELAEGGEVEALAPPSSSVDRAKGKYYIEKVAGNDCNRSRDYGWQAFVGPINRTMPHPIAKQPIEVARKDGTMVTVERANRSLSGAVDCDDRSRIMERYFRGTFSISKRLAELSLNFASCSRCGRRSKTASDGSCTACATDPKGEYTSLNNLSVNPAEGSIHMGHTMDSGIIRMVWAAFAEATGAEIALVKAVIPCVSFSGNRYN